MNLFFFTGTGTRTGTRPVFALDPNRANKK